MKLRWSSKKAALPQYVCLFFDQDSHSQNIWLPSQWLDMTLAIHTHNFAIVFLSLAFQRLTVSFSVRKELSGMFPTHQTERSCCGSE